MNHGVAVLAWYVQRVQRLHWHRGHTAFQRAASTDTKYYAFWVSGTKNVYSIFSRISAQTCKAKMMELTKVADENSKKKVYWCTKKWKCSVNLLFRKSLNRSEHRTQHHFSKMNNSRRCQQTQFSSTAGFGNEMKSKSRLPLFFFIHIRCEHAFCLHFVVFCIWVNSDTCWQLD